MYIYRQLSPEQRADLVKQRRAKGYPPHSPPHPILGAEFYLITAACYEHCHHINTPKRRQELADRLFAMFAKQEIEIKAWVILTNHYHFLVTTVDFKWLSQEIRLIHGRLAREWNQETSKTGKIWCSYSDRAIRSEKHFYTAINYIHYNPVKHNHVKSPYEWEESSVH
ncbi:MAG: hypothetical protein VKK07_14145 [Merismopediaceae bacterium]|nr:hypothetical protein [Merismopediaceae bacterium]